MKLLLQQMMLHAVHFNYWLYRYLEKRATIQF